MSLKDKMLDYLQTDRRRSIHVPEFDETIYVTPVNVLEMEKLMTLSGTGASNKEFHIWSIIEKAEDAEGKKIFGVEDKPYLEKMDWSIISKISNEIHRTVSFDEAKKNSTITPS
jgi:hypothetical protein